MILKFENFLNEGKGISDINKIYTDYFVEYYKQLGHGEFTIDDSDDQRLPLKNCLLIIKKGDIHALFDPSYSELKKEGGEYYLYNVVFNIEINNEDIYLLKELISHELNHCIEYYNISKWNEENKIKDEVFEIKPKHLSIKKSIGEIKIEKDNPFSFFKHLIYLSLDSEYNSRVSQFYQHLKSFDNKNEEFLKDKIKYSKSYLAYMMLNDFNSEEFVEECIDKIGLNGIILITKSLNKQLENNNINKLISYNFIKDITIEYQDLINYYKKWEKLFKFKNKKHIENLYRMIDAVIDENGLREGYKLNHENN